jgi:hypothetical protein
MQLQDAFSIPKIFIGLDIHKKAGQFLSKQIYFFSQDLFDASNEDLYQYVERTFPDHAVI